ncbi:MAG: hypothetical protein AAGF46_07975 [Pseudomonadota bacterium]
MNDDDIPVLTNVVKRERRAAPALTEANRQALIEAIEVRTAEALESRIEHVLEQFTGVLQDKLRRELSSLVPAIVDDVFSEWLARHQAALDRAEDN